MRTAALLLLGTFAVIGCDRRPVETVPPPPPPTAAVAPVAPAAAAGPTITTPAGYVIQVEVASNDDTRARGLMFRDRLDDDRGMLFIFPRSGLYPFWMKNTLIELDMIWLDEAHRIVRIRPNIPPCQVDPCVSYSPEKEAKYVLELAGGRAAKLQLREGDVLIIRGIDNYRVN